MALTRPGAGNLEPVEVPAPAPGPEDVVIRVLALDFHGRRILERRSRERILRAIKSAREHVSLRRALRLVRLSRSRFHEWSREPNRCDITEVEDCPRRSPGRSPGS